MKKIIIIGGGTISHVRNHLALCAPAYGSTANAIAAEIKHKFKDYNKRSGFQGRIHYEHNNEEYTIETYLTKMAGGSNDLQTNNDIESLIDKLILDREVKIIFFNPALVDFSGIIGEVKSGKYAERLETSKGKQTLELNPTNKIIGKIRQRRKDIFVIGFKTTNDDTSYTQYIKGLELLKKNSLNLVVANDTVTRNNMIIVPEEAKYFETTNREKFIKDLVEMTWLRMDNTFTRSTVIDGFKVNWSSEQIPNNLREVVNYCITNGAYKPFLEKTAGHFAVKLNAGEIITSIRKTNFNNLKNVGLVRVKYDGQDTVIAYGAKPSVGGMSQRIIFKEHSDADCIVHFHCPPKKDINTIANPKNLQKNEISIQPQMPYECGSHQCGQNTSNGLYKVDLGDGDYLKAVYLDNHGPNIVFGKNVPAQKVIDYIDRTFDLQKKTGGLLE